MKSKSLLDVAWRALPCLVSAVLPVAACTVSSAGPGASDAGGAGDASGDAATDSPNPDGGVDAGGDATACTGSNVLPAYITQNTTLTAACSPYEAPQPVLVGDATNHPVLTIEPGVTIEFASGAYLSIGMAQTSAAPGGLQAVGTTSSPIVFTSDASSPAPGSWGGIYFNPDADPKSALSYASVMYAGQQYAPLTNSPVVLGSVYVDAGSASPLSGSPQLHVRLAHVTLAHEGGSGFVFFGPFAGFAPGSGQLTIADWAAGGYPIVIDGNAADTIPATLTTGTGKQGAVGIVQEVANSSSGGQVVIVHDETWPALPIPYEVDESDWNGVGQCGVTIDGTSANATVTLTIAAPNTIEVGKPPTGGPCGFYVSTSAGYGRIVASGTANAGITFTSAQANPAPGDWGGITVFADPTTGSWGSTAFAYCTFSYAAAATFPSMAGDGTCLTSGTSTCGPSELYFNGGSGCMGAAGPSVSGPPVSHCTFTGYAACGVDGLDLLNESTTYGSGTTGANGNTFTPASGNTLGVCTQKNC